MRSSTKVVAQASTGTMSAERFGNGHASACCHDSAFAPSVLKAQTARRSRNWAQRRGMRICCRFQDRRTAPARPPDLAPSCIRHVNALFPELLGFLGYLSHGFGVPDDSPVNAYGFLDYRTFLRALYAHKKQHEYGFSHRAFSRRAGLKSVN